MLRPRPSCTRFARSSSTAAPPESPTSSSRPGPGSRNGEETEHDGKIGRAEPGRACGLSGDTEPGRACGLSAETEPGRAYLSSPSAGPVLTAPATTVYSRL